MKRLTTVIILNSAFNANNATNIESTDPEGIFDVGECAGAHISSCSCVGILNTTFEDNIGIGLCLRDISGNCEQAIYESTIYEYPPEFAPLFLRDAIAGEQNVGMINDFVGEDVDIAADVRFCTFRNNTAASLLRLDSEPVQQDSLTGGTGLDILDVPYSALVSLDFENNNGRQGSGIHLDTCTAAVIWNNTLVGNTATHEGGAIATVNSHGKGVLLGASSLSGNRALSGGALYGDSGASILVTNGTQLVNNTADTNGGAASCNGCQALTLQLGCIATGNVAAEDGGALYGDSGASITVQNGTLLVNNTAADNGGAVSCDGCQALVLQRGCTATANVAADDGGACYCSGCTLFLLDQVQLFNNRYSSPSHAVCSLLDIITSV